MRKADGILVHSRFDVFLDNVGHLFNKSRRKELSLERMIAADNVTALAQQVTNKATANQKIHFDKCPLIYWACCCNSYHVLLFLLVKGADCNQPDLKLNYRALDHCIRKRDWSLARLLLSSGNADARLVLPGRKRVTSFDMADNATQELIKTLEAKKRLLTQLKEQYGQQKELADKAYKQADMNKAREYYGQAAYTYKAMADWWQELASDENIPILKEYYQKQVKQHLKSYLGLASHADFYQQEDVNTLRLSFS